MRRVLIYSIGLNVLVASLIVGVIAGGRASAREEDSLLPGMSWCAGRLCFRGVIPGVTLWLDVSTILGGDVVRRWPTNVIAAAGEVDYYVISDQENIYSARVLMVHISPQHFRALPPLSAFVGRFGTPCAISPVTDKSVKIYYPFIEMGVTTRNRTLSMDSIVYSVTMVDPERSRSVRYFCNRRGDTYIWRGFASLDRYIAHWPQE